MKRSLLPILSLCLLAFAVPATAQIILTGGPLPLPITGNLGTIAGTPAPDSYVSIALVNCSGGTPTVTGYMGIVQTSYRFVADVNGQINGTIWANDQLTCGGITGATQYALSVYNDGLKVGTTQCYSIYANQHLWNVTTQQAVACAAIVPIPIPPPNPQDATFNNLTSNVFLQGNNGAFSGDLMVTGAITGHSSLDLPLAGGNMTGGILSNLAGNFSGLGLSSLNDFLAGGISPPTLWSGQQLGSSALEAMTFGIAAPTLSSLHQVNGIGSYATTASATTNAVGSYPNAEALANGTTALASNPVVSDVPGLTGNQFLWGSRTECNLFSPNSRAWCINITGRWGRQPAGTTNDQAIGMKISQPIDTNTLAPHWQWNVGLNVDNASTQGPAIQVGALAASGTNVASQWLSMFGFDGSGNPYHGTLGMDTAQRWALGFSTLTGNVFTFSPAGDFISPRTVQGVNIQAVTGNVDQDTSLTNFAAALPAGHFIANSVGQGAALHNHANFGFNYTGGTGSTSNTAYVGAGGPQFTVDGNGNAQVNGNLIISGGTCTGCGGGGGGGGTVTTVAAPSASWPTWLVPTVSSATTTPSITVAASVIPNVALANPSMIINAVSCSLGGSCAIPAGSVSSMAAPSGSWPTWLVPAVTNSTTNPSLAVTASSIPNAALTNDTMTINAVPCTLGSTCAIPAGSVSSVAAPSGGWPTWLVPSVATSTTTPSLTVAASAIPNGALANSGMTINAVSCSLGASCSLPTGSVSSVAAPSGSWPTWLVPTVTNSTTTPSVTVAASAIPNAALANASLTVNSISCTLGGSCSIPTGTGTVTQSASANGQFAKFTSSTNITGVNTTGSGNVVLSTSPTLTTGLTISGCASGTFAKADGTGCAIPSGTGTVTQSSSAANQIASFTTATNITGLNTTGTGNVVLATSPTFGTGLTISGCGAGTFAKADGSGCATPSGSGTVTSSSASAGQIALFSSGTNIIGANTTGSGQVVLATSPTFATGLTLTGCASGSYLKADGSGCGTPSGVGGGTIYTNAEFDNGTCTTAKTINPTNGNRQKVTLTNGQTCALTFTQPTLSTVVVQLKIIQSAVSTFNGGISGCKWAGGIVPTITQTTGAVDMLSAYLDGTNAYCQIAQAFQ